MGNIKKVCEEIANYSLDKLELNSDAALQMVMTTGQTESGYDYLRQIKGPAIGFWQVEPFTMNDTIENYVNYRPELKTKLYALGYDEKDAEMRLMSNMSLQVAFCRLKYRRDKHALPGMDDIEAQAKYWKRIYNSEKGRGTVEHFIKANK